MSFSKQNTRVEWWQSKVTYAVDQVTPLAVKTQVFMRSRLVGDAADGNEVVEKPWNEVAFNLLGDAKDVSVTAAGKTVTGAQLGALMKAMALNRANAGGIT